MNALSTVGDLDRCSDPEKSERFVVLRDFCGFRKPGHSTAKLPHYLNEWPQTAVWIDKRNAKYFLHLFRLGSRHCDHAAKSGPCVASLDSDVPELSENCDCILKGHSHGRSDRPGVAHRLTESINAGRCHVCSKCQDVRNPSGFTGSHLVLVKRRDQDLGRACRVCTGGLGHIEYSGRHRFNRRRVGVPSASQFRHHVRHFGRRETRRLCDVQGDVFE